MVRPETWGSLNRRVVGSSPTRRAMRVEGPGNGAFSLSRSRLCAQALDRFPTAVYGRGSALPPRRLVRAARLCRCGADCARCAVDVRRGGAPRPQPVRVGVDQPGHGFSWRLHDGHDQRVERRPGPRAGLCRVLPRHQQGGVWRSRPRPPAPTFSCTTALTDVTCSIPVFCERRLGCVLHPGQRGRRRPAGTDLQLAGVHLPGNGERDGTRRRRAVDSGWAARAPAPPPPPPPPPPPEPPHTVSVAVGGPGSGTVSSAPEGIACGSSCTHSFAAGTSVQLTATAADGSAFAGWGGACSGIAAVCYVTVSADATVTALFDSDTAVTADTRAVRCVVPALRGLTLVAVQRSLARAHCRLGTITRVRSRAALRGRVVSQQPAPGRHLAAGAKVSVTVGSRD